MVEIVLASIQLVRDADFMGMLSADDRWEKLAQSTNLTQVQIPHKLSNRILSRDRKFGFALDFQGSGSRR